MMSLARFSTSSRFSRSIFWMDCARSFERSSFARRKISSFASATESRRSFPSATQYRLLFWRPSLLWLCAFLARAKLCLFRGKVRQLLIQRFLAMQHARLERVDLFATILFFILQLNQKRGGFFLCLQNDLFCLCFRFRKLICSRISA